MTRNIVLLSDGTGNSSSQLFRTNVWRLYQALDVSDAATQIAFYNDGVGSSSFRPFALLGGIFGFGLRRNVLELYCFCCRNFEPGARIYGFGFSRGAFTMRIVAGMIARHGLVTYDNDEGALWRAAADVYRAYRQSLNQTSPLVTLLRNVRDAGIRAWRALTRTGRVTQFRADSRKVHFLGLWDTVEAYGGPVQEVTRAIDQWYWPLSMPDRILNGNVHRACHALSIDDERDAFWPVLWDERYVWKADGSLADINEGWRSESPAADLPAIDNRRMSQVWFPGVHADIGGGYSREGLSFVTLDWMAARAEAYGLKFDATARQAIADSVDQFDIVNDSRRGIAGYYRYKPRDFAELREATPFKSNIFEDLPHIASIWRGRRDPQTKLAKRLESQHAPLRAESMPIIHDSVFRRIFEGADGYAPIKMPENYCVTDAAGNIVAAGDPRDRPAQRSAGQEHVANVVWKRRVVYFATVFVSLGLAALPLYAGKLPDVAHTYLFGPAGAVTDAAEMILPTWTHHWTRALAQAPFFFLLEVVLVVLLLKKGSALQHSAGDLMRGIWHKQSPDTLPAGPIYRLRRSGPYRTFFYVLKQWLLPMLIALLPWFLLWEFLSRR